MTEQACAGDDESLHPFERLLAEVSARFISLPADQVDAAILDALERIGRLIGVDRSNLIRIEADGRAAITHSWARIRTDATSSRDISVDYVWILARIRRGEAVVVPRVADLPPEAARDQHHLLSGRVKSHLSVPLRVGRRIEGALAFGALEQQRDWTEAIIERAGAIAAVFGNALAHKHASEALDAALAFERTISEVQAALLEARGDDHHRAITAALGMLGRSLAVHRASLWRRLEGGTRFERTHAWYAADPEDRLQMGDTHAIPWLVERIASGTAVSFGRRHPATADERGDLERLASTGVRSGAIVPLSSAGKVIGALSFTSREDDRAWSSDLLGRMAFVGGVFASLIEREASARREQEAQAQAIHAARVGSMGMFAASLVHELSQPLAASLANAETATELLGQSTRQHELRATLADLVADNRRAADQVQQLRRLLRRGENERSSVDIADIVREALRIVEPLATAKQVVVDASLAEGLGQVVVNRAQVQQVLINLLMNALDAVQARPEEERRVALGALAGEASLVIEVSDNGSGIDAPTLSRIFEPFFTTKTGGMGLGLSISRNIAAGHGGMLSAQSTIGEGATFRFELPRAGATALANEPDRRLRERPEGCVHVIEDDASMRRALERQLGAAGYEVRSFASAEDFLAGAPAAGRACIVTDVRMPGASGIDLQGKLARRETPLPVIFISGHGDVPMTVEAMKGGAVGFLPKPFAREDLLDLVVEALARCDELRARHDARAELVSRHATLTPREREVFALVSQGLLNKVVADRLGATEATIKVHRARVMDKLGAQSLADLVRIAERLGEPRAANAKG